MAGVREGGRGEERKRRGGRGRGEGWGWEWERARAPRQTLWCQRYACWCLVLVNGNYCGVFTASIPPFSSPGGGVGEGEKKKGWQMCVHSGGGGGWYKRTSFWHVEEEKDLNSKHRNAVFALLSTSITHERRRARDGLRDVKLGPFIVTLKPQS